MSDTVMLDREQIARLVPHSGPMCLLSHLLQWNEQDIVCGADNHRDAHHPLRTPSGLLSTALIEYAAQAMALHGALIGAARHEDIRPGYLASVRGARFFVLCLDELPAAEPDVLRIAASRQAGDDRQILYAFSVHHAGQLIADGRAAVVLNSPVALS